MTQTSNSSKIFDNGMFSISFAPECIADQPLIIALKEAAAGPCKSEPTNQFLKDAAISLDAESSVAFLEFLSANSRDFYALALEIKAKSLRASGKINEAISLLRYTNSGNLISGAWDDGDGPTQLDLFYSYFLNECSAEWLAEQLNISLAEVKRIWSLWDDSFQEGTPETAQRLEEALKEVMGPDVYEKAAKRDILDVDEALPDSQEEAVHRTREPLTIADEGKHLEDLVHEVDVLHKDIKALGNNQASICWQSDGTLCSFDAFDGHPAWYWAEHHEGDSRESFTSLASFIQYWKDQIASHKDDCECTCECDRYLLSKPCWVVVEDKK